MEVMHVYSHKDLVHSLTVSKVSEDNAVTKLKQMLSDGYEVNATDQNGNTALHILLSHLMQSSSHVEKHLNDKLQTDTNVQIGEILIDHLANLNVKNNEGETCLLLAVKCYTFDHLQPEISKPIVKRLLQRKANVHIKDKHGNTALHIATQVQQKPSVVEIVKDLIIRGTDVNDRNNNGETPLMAELKNISQPMKFSCSKILCQILLEGGSGNIMDNFGFTPLHWLVSTCLLDSRDRYFFIQHLLLENNKEETCQVNAMVPVYDPINSDCTSFFAHTKPYQGLTCLQIAVMRGHAQNLFQLLLAGADVHVNYPDGYEHKTLLQHCMAYMLFSELLLAHRHAPIGEICLYFKGILHLLSAGVPYIECKGNSQPNSAHEINSVSYLQLDDKFSRLENRLFDSESSKTCRKLVECLIIHGYQFNVPKIQNSSRLDKKEETLLTTVENIPSLQFLTAKTIRQNLYPNAWVASSKLPIPSKLISKYFKVPKHSGDFTNLGLTFLQWK